jgi:hypothetical protein
MTIVMKAGAILHPVMPVRVPHHVLYNLIIGEMPETVGANGFLTSLGVIFCLFFQSIYIVHITGKHKLFHRVTLIPAFIFLLLTSAFPQFSMAGETILVNWILLAAIDSVLGLSVSQNPRKLIFNSGFIISLCSLFQFSYLGFFLLLVVALVMLRPFSIGEWSVMILGYLTPLYFFICFLFLTDNWKLFHDWVHIGFSAGPHLLTKKQVLW